MFIRAKILSEVFTNLAVGWLGLILITPQLVIFDTLEGIFFTLLKPLLSAIVSLIAAELILQISENDLN